MFDKIRVTSKPGDPVTITLDSQDLQVLRQELEDHRQSLINQGTNDAINRARFVMFLIEELEA